MDLRLARIAQWGKLLARFLSLQIAAQFLGFVTGLIAVRWLPMEGFGKYSIIVATQGTAAVLADIGVSGAVFSIGGRVFGDPQRFGDLIRSALEFRRRLEATALVVAIPMQSFLILKSGGSWNEVAVVGLALVVSVHGQVTSSVYSVVPLIRLRFQEVQYVNIAGALFRIVAISVSVWFTHDYRWAVWMAAVSFAGQGILMRQFARVYLNHEANSRAEDQRELMKVFRSQIVSGLYFAFSPQLTVLLISLFGNVDRVAEAGALGRLAVVFTAVSGILSNLVTPRFARLQGTRILLRRYGEAVAVAAFFGMSLFIITVLFPREILWLIGPKYAGLSGELVLIVGLSVFNLISTTVASLNISRAWTRGSWLSAPGALFTQVILLRIVDVSTVRGAILFGWGALVAPFITGLVLSWQGLRDEKEREPSMKLTPVPPI